MLVCETVSAVEAAGLLGVGRSALYAALKQGRVPALKVGRKPRYRIPRRVIERLLDNPQEFAKGRKRSQPSQRRCRGAVDPQTQPLRGGLSRREWRRRPHAA